MSDETKNDLKAKNFDATDIIDNIIQPRMLELRELCDKHGIPHIFAFYYSEDDERFAVYSGLKVRRSEKANGTLLADQEASVLQRMCNALGEMVTGHPRGRLLPVTPETVPVAMAALATMAGGRILTISSDGAEEANDIIDALEAKLGAEEGEGLAEVLMRAKAAVKEREGQEKLDKVESDGDVHKLFPDRPKLQ